MVPVAMLHFHHIGVGTIDFDGAIAVYQGMRHELLVRFDDALLNARIALLSVPRASFPCVELVSPLGPGGPLKGLLSRKALPAPYHSCYATPRIAEATSELRRLGFRPTGVPRPALAFSGALVSFHFNRSIGLLELVEDPGYPENPALRLLSSGSPAPLGLRWVLAARGGVARVGVLERFQGLRHVVAPFSERLGIPLASIDGGEVADP